MRRLALPLIAVALVAAVLGVQVAAGGGHYVPRRPANPCTPRPVPPIPAQLEPLAEQIVLLGLDSAACRLGISRERLVPRLAGTPTLAPPHPGARPKAACPRCPSCFPRRSAKPISPGSPRPSLRRFPTESSTTFSPPGRS